MKKTPYKPPVMGMREGASAILAANAAKKKPVAKKPVAGKRKGY